MNLEHIALNISEPEEIKSFFCEILGMREIRHFVLDRKLAGEIFGIEKETASKADQHGYSCIRLTRGNSELIFIKDKSGNIFELKQAS